MFPSHLLWHKDYLPAQNLLKVCKIKAENLKEVSIASNSLDTQALHSLSKNKIKNKNKN